MSRRKLTQFEDMGFVERLVEVCGTSKPAKMSKILDVSYQAAKNYLQGRLPDTKVLLTISKQTHYSLDWLITGEGKKFRDSDQKTDKEVFTDEMEAFVRRICLEVINEVLGGQTKNQDSKLVVISPYEIKQEEILDDTIPAKIHK